MFESEEILYLIAITVFLIHPATAQSEVNISSGEVRPANISSPNVTTNNWAGIYGNVSIEFTVGQNQNPFFAWTGLDASNIYATSQPLDFSSDWSAATLTDMTDQYPFLEPESAGGNEAGSASSTFNYTDDFSSDFQQNHVNDTIAAQTYNEEGNPYWPTLYMNEEDGGFFASPIKSGKSYSNVSADYQLILPEDGLGNENVTQYNLYIELSD